MGTFRQVLFGLCAAGIACSQPPETPAFEVASIKLSGPMGSVGVNSRLGCGGGPGTTDPGSWTCVQVTLPQLILTAYSLQPYQLAAASDWIRDRFDIHAKIPAATTRADFRRMQQRLLEERFKLKLRREQKEGPVYELTVAKSGLKMKDSADSETAPAADGVIPKFSLDKQGFPSFPPGVSGKLGLNGHMRWTAHHITMEEMVTTLSGEVERPVIDATGLKGAYDLDMHWVKGQLMAKAAGADGPEIDGPTIEQAIQSQLGLKIESKKGMVETVVIEHAEKVPIEN